MEETVTQGIRRPQSPESFSYDEAMLLVSVSQCSSDECQKMPHNNYAVTQNIRQPGESPGMLSYSMIYIYNYNMLFVLRSTQVSWSVIVFCIVPVLVAIYNTCYEAILKISSKLSKFFPVLPGVLFYAISNDKYVYYRVHSCY